MRSNLVVQCKTVNERNGAFRVIKDGSHSLCCSVAVKKDVENSYKCNNCACISHVPIREGDISSNRGNDLLLKFLKFR